MAFFDIDPRRIWCLRYYGAHEYSSACPDNLYCLRCGVIWSQGKFEVFTFDRIRDHKWAWLRRWINWHVFRYKLTTDGKEDLILLR